MDYSSACRPQRIRRANTAPRRPPRYEVDWVGQFEGFFAPDLVVGVSILDVGSGRRPILLPSRRPAGCRYVGMDVSSEELDAAPSGAYDEVVVGNITTQIPTLNARFDLVISWQVLEHVKPLHLAVENIRSYLRPGGHFVALLSGRFALFSLLGRMLPHSVGARAMQHLLHREPDTVFPAPYDGCYYSALEGMLAPWSRWDIVPRYYGAMYLSFAPLLEQLYLIYENWAERSGHRNLATHYLVSARR
jgi:SAM-dependent methyltransferase